MMKKPLLTFVLMSAVAFCGLQSCGSSRQNTVVAGSSATVPASVAPSEHSAQNDVSMEVVPPTYTRIPEKIVLRISNHSTAPIEFGAAYTIEYFDNNAWKILPFSQEIAFIAIMFTLPPGESNNYEISLYPDLAEYKSGLYRVRKSILRESGNLEITAEFTIQSI